MAKATVTEARGRMTAASKTSSSKPAKSKDEVKVLRDDCRRVLSEDNRAAKKVPMTKDQALRCYRNMVLTRAFDERGMMLQRQGRIGFYVPSFGQEAIQTGTAAALEMSDWVFPSYREPGVFLYRGVEPYYLLCNLWGNAADLCKGRQMPVHYSFPAQKMFSVSSPIATQAVQAAGAAYAAKVKKNKQVAITYFGDGATSENDFHTGMTFAAVTKAPVVFICTNNQYAISVPLRKQSGTPKLVDKAIGYGMPGVAVDGNDLFAVYEAAKEAVDRARRGDGPTFIECVTLRMGPHSSSDDPTRYRDESLYQAWRKRDPIDRLRAFIQKDMGWTSSQEEKLQSEIKELLLSSVERAEAEPPPDIDTLFEDVFSELTPQLEKQRAELRAEKERRGQFENTSEAFPL